MDRLVDAKLWIIALGAGLLATGCITTTEEGSTHISGAADGFFEDDGFGETGDGVREAWDENSDPANWREHFEYSYESLSRYRSGAAKTVPWPGDYWPMVADGYNQRWQGSEVLSPAERYDLAFNGWTPPEDFQALRPFSSPRRPYDAGYYESLGPFARWSHERGGNYRARQMWNPDGTLVGAYSQCDRNGDGRFDSDAPLGTCDLDGNERIGSDDERGGLQGWFGHCHAWAPAAFSMAEPQHAVEYNGVRFEISDLKALGEASFEGGSSVFLGARCNALEVERDEYGRILLDECRDTNAGAFHVVIVNVVGRLGGSFVADVTTDYQVWNHPVRRYEITTSDVVSEQQALGLLGRSDLSRYADIVPERDRDARWERWREELASFVHIRMNFDYIVESRTSTRPMVPNIDDYTNRKYYDYILELDGEGNIIGGEWISENPPDFLWAPRHQGVDVRDRTYRTILSAENVQMLFQLAADAETDPGEEPDAPEPGEDEPDPDACEEAYRICMGPSIDWISADYCVEETSRELGCAWAVDGGVGAGLIAPCRTNMREDGWCQADGVCAGTAERNHCPGLSVCCVE